MKAHRTQQQKKDEAFERGHLRLALLGVSEELGDQGTIEVVKDWLEEKLGGKWIIKNKIK